MNAISLTNSVGRVFRPGSGNQRSGDSWRHAGSEDPAYTTCRSRPGWFDINGDRTPLALAEAQETQRRARDVTDEDRGPDVEGIETGHRLEDRTEPERHDHLRDDRDPQRASRVAGALQAACIGERNGDEQTR